MVLKEIGGLHDLARLAITTLRDSFLAPGNLQRMPASSGESLDGGDHFPGYARYRLHAGTNRPPVDMHRACAAQRLTASILGACQGQMISQDPKEWCGGIDIDGMRKAVDVNPDLCHDVSGRF